MAPTVPIDYTGKKKSKKFSKTAPGDIMGKARKISKGYSTTAVDTMAEPEGFRSSCRVDAELAASEDGPALERESYKFCNHGQNRFGVPMRVLQLSKMSRSETRDLEMRLKSELEQVRMLQSRVASSLANEIHIHQNGSKKPAMVESLPISTNDVASLQGKKKSFPPGRNGPLTKGASVAGKRTEPVKQGQPQNANHAILMKQCQTQLTQLMLHDHAWIFLEPVDIVKHKIPDYFNVIKHPMDLGTVKKKLRLGQYTSPMGFAADVRLTFKNAMTYNPAGHDVHVMAKIMSEYFERKWKPIEKKLSATADKPTAPKPSVIIEPEIANVPPPPPTKKQKTTSVANKVEQETDKRVMSAQETDKQVMSAQETDKRVMSAHEKQKIGEQLETYMAELPDNIIDFIKKSTSNGSQVSEEDEIEIDFDVLNDDTLFTLRKLLDDFEKQKNKAKVDPCKSETCNESGFSNLSPQPCKDNESADEDVDIGGDDPPLMCSSTPIEIDRDPARKNSNHSNSSSSSSDSGSSSSDSDSASSSSELDVADNSVPANTETVDPKAEQKESDPKTGGLLNGHVVQNEMSNSSCIELNGHQEGESGVSPSRQVSPEKLYRAALLRGRFADIIIKAQENTSEKGEKPDIEKLKREKEEVERRRREEKARLQAEAEAAEKARKKAEEAAAAEAKRKREAEREAARQALQKMEKTVEINGNSQYMEDLEMFSSAPDDEQLQLQGNSFIIEEASPENSQNGLPGFKFQASSNPLEQLGLFMKNDEEDDEDVEPQNHSSPEK